MEELELIPVGDRIIIEPLENEEVTSGGIHIPNLNNSKDITQKARIVGVGSGVLINTGERIKPEVKVGDIVVFNKLSGMDIKIRHRPYKVITEREIIGIVREVQK